MLTQVWINDANGHHFADEPEGMTLNGKPVQERPKWVQGEPDMVFGEKNEWSGGKCPVDGNTLVRCIFRGRNPYIGPAIYPDFSRDAQAAMWKHAPAPLRFDPKMDIVAYQVSVA